MTLQMMRCLLTYLQYGNSTRVLALPGAEITYHLLCYFVLSSPCMASGYVENCVTERAFVKIISQRIAVDVSIPPTNGPHIVICKHGRLPTLANGTRRSQRYMYI